MEVLEQCQAKEYVAKCLLEAAGDEFLSLKYRLQAKVRVLRKSGFFLEAAEELVALQNELTERMDGLESQSSKFRRHMKLLIRLLRERMAISAVRK